MSRTTLLIVCAMAFAALAACRSGGQIPTSAGDFGGGGANGAGGAGGGVSTTGAGDGANIGVTAEEAARQRLLDQYVVYFDFDRSDIRPDFNEMLAAHGSYLASNPNVSVRLEGHADETGSREYNIGLGERRAQSVRQILLLQGASASQLSTVSYGEERPAALGSDEESYSLNRRVEIVYR